MTTPARCMLLLLVVALGGCKSPTYQSLRSEREIETLAPLLELRPELTTVRVPTGGAYGRELDLAVFEQSPSSDRVIVFIHGVLADSKAWRFVTGPLDDDGDLLLVDLPGNGESDDPLPFVLKREDPDAYSTPALAYRGAEAISARLAARPTPPAKVAIVAHSLGTLVTMRMLSDPSIAPDDRAWMDLVDRVVLISPIDPALPYGPPSLEKVATTPWWFVEAGELSGYLREKVALGARQTFVNPENMPREQVDDLLEIIADTHKRNVAQDLLKTVLPTHTIDGVYYPDWDETERVVELQRALGEREDLEVLMIVGERDEVAPSAMAYRIAMQLPDAQIVVLARTKHSPHIEHAALTARLIEQFIRADEERGIGPATRSVVIERRIDPDQ